MTGHQRNALWFGIALAVFLVVGVVWRVATDEDESDSGPTPGELRSSAEFVCQQWVEDRVDPLDVKFRDPGSSTVSVDGNRYTVHDRANVEGDLVLYDCETTLRSNGDWKLEAIKLR